MVANDSDLLLSFFFDFRQRVFQRVPIVVYQMVSMLVDKGRYGPDFFAFLLAQFLHFFYGKLKQVGKDVHAQDVHDIREMFGKTEVFPPGHQERITTDFVLQCRDGNEIRPRRVRIFVQIGDIAFPDILFLIVMAVLLDSFRQPGIHRVRFFVQAVFPWCVLVLIQEEDDVIYINAYLHIGNQKQLEILIFFSLGEIQFTLITGKHVLPGGTLFK